MVCLHGKTVCGGTVSGTAHVFRRKTEYGTKNKTVCVSEESQRLEAAFSAVREKLAMCAEQAESDTARDILDVHRMMLEDEDVLDFLRNAVRNDGTTAEMAVSQTQQHFSKLFSDTEDSYLIARIDDIRDVCGELMSFLSQKAPPEQPREPVILVADELLPSDLMQLDRKNLKGIVMGSGTLYSHASILIREMGIPATICEAIDKLETGMSVLLNASDGTVCFAAVDESPEEEILALYAAAEKKKASPFVNLPCGIYVNIGDPRELSDALMEKCNGIGLFRTEYMYLGKTCLPDEEEQFSVYKDVLQRAKGKVVTVRTFDIGSDKGVEALPLEEEENPALGFRGLRVYSLYPEVFKTQLRALLRAAAHGNLRIMYPMVTSGEEIDEIGQMLAQAAQELEGQGIPYRIPQQGAMIETPAAALLSSEIAEKVDFLSVGTNDLTQYTLAIDRQNGRLERFSDSSHRAILSLIKTATENAHRNGIEIGICGELASQPELIGKWLEFGIDHLSVSPFIVNDATDH